MPERIYKLQPDRTIHLRGFDSFAAAASIHSASPSGFKVSGSFRDPADLAVAVLYDADNFFEHPSLKYLPDFNFAGLTLNFSVQYADTVQPIDSPKYNWIDWATLDCILADGTVQRVTLWDSAMLAGDSFPAASAAFQVVTQSGIQPNNRLTLWYQNLAFDYTVPPGSLSVVLDFYAGTKGAIHSVTINGRTYSHAEAPGENSASQAAAIASAINAGDPDVVASAAANAVTLTVAAGGVGHTVSISASDGNPPATMYRSTPDLVAAAIANVINNYNWIDANSTHGLIATNNGAELGVTAARFGKAAVNRTSVTWLAGTRFSGITSGSAFVIGGTTYFVASVQSPVQLTLTSDAGTAPNTQYVAPRGGRDGNMIHLYALANSPSTLAFGQSQIQLSGGSSEVTWNCSIDFTALKIDQLRQCWLTFAPALSNGTAFAAAEWQATFSNWQLNGPESVKALQVAGPGSVRIEEDDTACTYIGKWSVESGFYSKYFAKAASAHGDSVSITYYCQFTHELYAGTSLYGTSAAAAGLTVVNDTHYSPSLNGNLYSDRGVVAVSLDGDAQTFFDSRVLTGSALVARRLLRSAVPAGRHTVIIRLQQPGFFYFDFLEAAVLSDVPDALTPRLKISPALDFDTDHTYKLSPSRLMWIMDKLGYAGPMNEYLGVFWWNERTAVGGSIATADVAFTGPFLEGESIFLNFSPPGGARLGKSILASDTAATIANHFAAFINESLVGAWAAVTGDGVITISGRSPAPPYNLALTLDVLSAKGSGSVTPPHPALGVYPTWVVDDTAIPPLNRAARDWHADFYALCAARGREMVTACSMELVNPPDGYVARYADHTAVSTATGFGSLNSNHCAAGSAKMIAYQKAVFRNIAQIQSDAGLVPEVQYGELLWWYLSDDKTGSGMGFYDDETLAAAQAALGRPLQAFNTPNDDPSVNGGADSLFLRNRLRDHVSALVADIRSAYPNVKCELLWPYDVNYPTPLPSTNPPLAGRLTRYINLPVEWQQQSSSGLDRVKVEALAFLTGLRNLDLSREAMALFPSFGWPLSALRYLVPVFGFATPWIRELDLVWSAGMPFANLWAFDHVCLYNLDVPERALERRSVVKVE